MNKRALKIAEIHVSQNTISKVWLLRSAYNEYKNNRPTTLDKMVAYLKSEPFTAFLRAEDVEDLKKLRSKFLKDPKTDVMKKIQSYLSDMFDSDYEA